jgi:hypothetical protein
MARDRVKVALGRTLNLGNFESLRIDIGLEMDVAENSDLARLTTARALRSQVESLLKEAVVEYTAELEGGKKSKKS